MNNPLEQVKPNRETNFTQVKQVRCNVALLNQAISAAEAALPLHSRAKMTGLSVFACDDISMRSRRK